MHSEAPPSQSLCTHRHAEVAGSVLRDIAASRAPTRFTGSGPSTTEQHPNR
jgi:hypothetical protein